MGMTADQLDRRVQFQRASVTDDGLQTGMGPFLPYGSPFAASRRDISDAEKMASGHLQSEVTARFCVRSCQFTRGLTTADRLICDGATFNILGIKEFGQRRTFLEITAVSAGGQ